ncbi:hypothetical protein GCM10025865_01100 [Paraoerskovia sediminicola]|uniref:Uncharacterized protein n=1 Tax=Paraoerskovia sediminicola TaxID=1138587 RepID=A0ABM8FYR1_9CELL|nr:hypothetical protein GCM10025865_01100 [Paraoerskovia sediminicola]
MDSRLDRLREAADLAWMSAQEAPADKRAPLIAQFRAALAEIDSLVEPEQKAGDGVDEIAARRAARGGATARLGEAAGGSR